MGTKQNMLQDTVRTSTYRSSILLNGPKCFQGKTVMDVGAGSGILSYFAVQAGADKVYAVEASGMAKKMKKLVDSADEKHNPFLRNKIEVVNGNRPITCSIFCMGCTHLLRAAKIEDPDLDIPKVDTIISEPIGVLLFHERMVHMT